MASIRKPYTGPEPECDATAATMARKPRHATRGQLEHRTRHVLAALERAQAAKQAPKAEGKLWRCKVGKHDSAEDAEICKRAHGAKRYFDRAPGYVAEEIAAERGKPASAPRIEDTAQEHISRSAWTAVWRETWAGAQQANNSVRYSSRAEFLADVAALHKLLWEVGYGAA